MYIDVNSHRLSSYLKESKTNKYIIFLHGGTPSLGKDRFKEWQDRLLDQSIGSFSFDAPGIATSTGVLAEQSLEKRIAMTVLAVRWFQQSHPDAELYLYGLSMGGYVASGLIHNMPRVFRKLILQAPAAYSRAAHTLNFNDSFTQELRRPDSWKNSFSFDWLREYDSPVLLIASENDATIPQEITETYKRILKNKNESTVFTLKGAPHAIWTESKEDRNFRDIVLKEILDFI